MSSVTAARRSVHTGALALILSVFLTGCASRSAPPYDYYSLTSPEPVAEPISLPVNVSRVRIPEYVDNDRIWVREDDQRVVAIPSVRWSEPISPAITRELRIALGASLTDDREAPSLIVDIERLEAQWLGDRQRVILRARWKLDGRSPTAPQTWQDERMISDRQGETIVLAMADLLSALYTDIRRELAETS